MLLRLARYYVSRHLTTHLTQARCLGGRDPADAYLLTGLGLVSMRRDKS